MSRIMSMNDRGRALETKYALDCEVDFRVNALTSKKVSEWAGHQLGLSGVDLRHFVEELLHEALSAPDEDIIKKRILADFAANQMEVTEHTIDKVFREMAKDARTQVMQ